MSEAELHLIRARLRGGIISKARRGELRLPLPIGFARDALGRTVLDPDEQVRSAIHRVFAVFRETESALAVVKRFRREGWLFPRRTPAFFTPRRKSLIECVYRSRVLEHLTQLHKTTYILV
jgi:DNA invertase Pin-like site-specific DNA recombinase